MIIDIVRSKQIHGVLKVSPDALVRDLVATLAAHRVGALVVSADGSRVDGIVSERDVVARLNDTPGLLDLPVSQIMTTDVQLCRPDANLREVAAQMTEHRVRHIPVVDEDGVLLGLVSIGDVVKTRIDQLEFERDQLEGYVSQS